MLAAIGIGSVDELFVHVPAHLRARGPIALPPGITETALRERLAVLGRRNTGARAVVFAGGGAYPHVVPALVDQVLQRSEFTTAYTPYQAEVSQGTLQAIFEFQTFVAMLLGLEVANASMYDGASAAAEAVLMARRLAPDRRVVWIARALHPHYRAVVATYVRGLGDIELREIPYSKDGRTDLATLAQALGPQALCVVLGYPNVFGVVEDISRAARLAHAAGALLVTVTTEALALVQLRAPGQAGADVAVAEGQSLGLPLSYGGPGVGLLASHERYVRSMPGRIVGETVDGKGRRGFVLTLATREQHIRRERATSNICTNQGLCALAVTTYLAALGRRGLQAVAESNLRAAHRAARLLREAGVPQVFDGPFFNEFVVRIPQAAARWTELATEAQLVAGVPLGRWYPEHPDALLLCVTEAHSAADVERLVEALGRARQAVRAVEA